MPKVPKTTPKRPRANKPAAAGGNGAPTAPDFEHRAVDAANAQRARGAAPAADRGPARAARRPLRRHRGARAPTAPSAIDRRLVQQAFVFACERHADQRRASGEDFIIHPVGVAKICAGMRLDTATLCAALLHDTVEDTSASLDEVRSEFGDEIAQLVDGVTKLTGITFQSRDDRQAENYRKMMVAMASDIRVILIKLADRLHNMRTIDAMPKNKQQEKAKETLEIFAPLAHRLGIHAIKWELEDLAFATLHPRKYKEIKGLVNQQREEREGYVARAGDYLRQGARGRRHRGRDLRPREALLLDLLEDDEEGPRVQRDLRPHRDARARRLGQGLLRRDRRHPLALEAAARALQGLRRDAQVQHVPGAAHDGDRARGPAARDPDPHARDARDRRVRHRRALDVQGRHERRPRTRSSGSSTWSTGRRSSRTRRSSPSALKADLFEDEVFVFTPKGEVKSLAAGATPLDFAYAVHTDVGHRCVGAKVNGKIVPLHYELQSGDICEVLTSKKERGPSRDWLSLAKTTRAQSKIRAWFKRERPRGLRAHRPRDPPGEPQAPGPAAAEDRRLAAARRRDPRDGLPQGRRLLHRARPGEDLGQGRRPTR